MYFSGPPGGGFDLGWFGTYLVPHLPLGVTLLFLLSAFLLYRPFAAAVMRETRVPSLRRYLLKRALRILPAYWFILLFTGLVLRTTTVLEPDGTRSVGALDDPVLLVLNIGFVQNFFPSTLLTGIGPAWALADVFVFYLVLPLLVLMAFGLAKRASTRGRRRLAVLVPAAVLLLLGGSGKAVAAFVIPGGAWEQSWHAVIERSFWAHADFFALGMAVAVFRVDSEDGVLKLPPWWRKAAGVTLVLVAVAAAKLTTAEGYADGSFSNYVYDSLTAIVCALFLMLVVLPAQDRPTALVRLLETRLLVVAGIVSYSIFLWQLPLIEWLRVHDFTFAETTGFVANVAVIGLLTLALSVFTYRCFEFPALRRKANMARRSAERQPLAVEQRGAPAQADAHSPVMQSGTRGSQPGHGAFTH